MGDLTMSQRWIRRSLLAGILCVVIPQVPAKELSAGLAACREEKDDARRLACYDREVGNLGDRSAVITAAPAAPATAPAATAATQAAVEQTPEEKFGYRGTLARQEQERAKDDARSLGKLEATVTGISARGDGALVMTLDNGQVWAQNRPDAFFRLKVGEQVKIEPAMLGSFLMISPSKRTARVTRQK
jgi:hypothetical protein